MKVLKKKFKKKVPGGAKLKHKIDIIVNPPTIKIKPKQGRWCEYYEGRIPYPIECSSNQTMPVSHIFKGKEVILVKDHSNCKNCIRFPQWRSWKNGDWNKIIEAIKNGEDLTNMPPPRQELK